MRISKITSYLKTSLFIPIIGVFLLGVSPSTKAALSHDPALHWQTLVTEHFYIHYHDGLKNLAHQVGAIAENVHTELSQKIRWTPRQRVHVVLSDEFDLANGSATPFPLNQMILLVTPPDPYYSLEDYGDWFEILIRHEYTHILHLDKGEGKVTFLRNILGRFPWLFPNVYQPNWLIEGFATYMETDTSRGIGRGQSSYFEMQMRTEVLNGLKPLNQMNQLFRTWPGGSSTYLYGVNFYQFIENKYGADKIPSFIDDYSDNLLPYSINSTARRVFQRNFSQLWQEFEAYLRAKHQPQIDQISQTGIVAGAAITHEGFETGHPRVDPTGRVIFIKDNGLAQASLVAYSVSQKKFKSLVNINPSSRFDVHDSGDIVIAQPDLYKNNHLVFDLYLLKSGESRLKRLTRGGRYIYVAWHPDGRHLYAVHNRLGTQQLLLLDAQGKIVDTLWTGDNHTVLSQIDLAPDGQNIVASLWRRTTGWNLELFSLENRQWQMLTRSTAIEGQPQFTPDGQSIIFSADYNGVYNIHRLNLSSGEIQRLSNVLGGAFAPSENLQGGLVYYAGYGPSGFDIYALNTQNQPLLETVIIPGSSGLPQEFPALEPTKISETPYRLSHSLLPRWWFPHFTFDNTNEEYGIITGGSDALQRHLYALDLAYNADADDFSWAINYLYDRWQPSLSLLSQQTFTSAFFSNSTNTVSRRTRFLEHQGSLTLPILHFNRAFSLQLAGIYLTEQDQYVHPQALPHAKITDCLVGAAAVYNSTKKRHFSISRNHGQNLALILEDSSPFNCDYNGRAYLLDWRGFLALGKQNVLALHIGGARGEQSIRPYTLGGFAAAVDTAVLGGMVNPRTRFNKRNLPLRGYAANIPQLSGDRLLISSLEWRFPITRIERGIMAPPFALDQISGTLFVDSGDAWYAHQSATISTGVGFEIDFKLFFGYNLPFNLKLGYAKGLEAWGQEQIYISTGTSF